MKASELRQMTREEILHRLDEAYQELMNFRFQKSFGQLKDTNRPRALRKDIARMKTVLREMELAAWEEEEVYEG